jgi:hypothetical protein
VKGGHLVPLGQEIGAMMGAVRDRVEVSSHDGTWQVTAGSFDDALAYARERFDAPVVLSRRDRGRWWPRVTLEITEDPACAASAPSLDELAHPAAPVEAAVADAPEALADDRGDEGMPTVLEEMFARQDVSADGLPRVPRQRRRH